MKPKFRNLFLSFGTALLATGTAHAGTVTWDANNTGAGQTDGAGVWLNANQWWDGTTNVNWTSGDDAIFGNGGAGGAITLASPTTVNSLTFNYFTGTYTIGTAGQALTLNSGITKNAGSGVATIISPLLLDAAQTWTNNSTTALNINNAVTLNGNLTIGGSGNIVMNSASAIIGGTGDLIKNGTGNISHGGNAPAHNFTGNLIINGGAISSQSNAWLAGRNTSLTNGYIGGRFGSGFTWTGANGGLGTGANQIQITGVSGFSGEGTSGSTFQIGGALSTLTWGSTFFNPTALIANGDANMNSNGVGALNNAIDLNGSNRTITSLQNTNGAQGSGFTINGAITNGTGTAGLTKTGIGNLRLIANNTYNGATNIEGGFITLATNGAINSTSALNLSGGGILRLVNTAQVNRLADGAAITVNRGGGITYENTSGTPVYTETTGAVTHNGGQFNVVLTTAQAGAGSQTLTLGGLTPSGTATATFSALGTGPQASGLKNMIVVSGAGTTANTGSATGREILGPWATTGTTAALQSDYAIYSSDYVVGVGITDSAETNWTNSAYAYTTSVGGTVTLTGTRTITALRNTGATSVLTLATGANLETYGLLNGTTTLLTVAPGTGGVLTTPTGGGNLNITAGSGAITISAPANSNGGNVNLVKSGSGTVTLTGANNTFGGDIAVNAGILQFGIGSPNTSVQLNGGSYAGNIFIGAGAALSFSGSGTNILSGDISGDGNLNLNRGTTTLSGDNTYTGKTSMTLLATNATGSTINISSFNSVVGGTASSSLGAPITVANGTIDFGGGVIQATAQINYTGSGEITDRVLNFQFNSGGARVIDSSGGANALLKFTSAAISNGTTTGSINLQGSTNGEFTQGLGFTFTNFTKSGAGTWTLGGVVGNTGITTVSANGGTLALQKKSSLLGGNTAIWTAAKVVVNTGGTLALNVGGAGEFGNGDVTTLLTNIGGAVSNNGLRAGSAIGFDTTNATGTFTITDPIANTTGTGGGAIGLTKRGTGILELSNANTYTGATTVSGGTLLINGSTSTTSLVTVETAGTLGGTGTVGGATTVNGALKPGNSPGLLTFSSSLTLAGTATTTIEIDGTIRGVGGYDAVDVGTSLAYGGALILDLGTVFGAGDYTFNLFDFGSQSGSFDTVDLAGLYSGSLVNNGSGVWELSDVNNTWSFNQGDGVLSLTAVPEPSAAALLGGLGAVLLLRRRR
jgi:fibronectin-binding autotransporter adhesin